MALLLVLMWFVDPVRWWLAILVAVRVHARRVAGAHASGCKIQLPAGVLAGFLG